MTSSGDASLQRSAPTDRELEQSEERFRLLVESVVDYAIFMLDPNGVIQTWNAGAERLKGYTQDEIVGQHYSTFYPETDREAGLPDELLASAKEQGSVTHSGWRVRKDGTRFWATVVITALWEEDGSLAGFAKVTRDMTDSHRSTEAREAALAQERQMVEHLEEVDAWRRDFVGSITHDLRSPLTSILGFTRTLLDEPVDEEEQRLFLERILSNAHSLQELLDHLRTFTLLEAGELELDPEPLDLGSLVTGLVDDMQPLLEDREITVEVANIEIVADRAGVRRIIRNLIENAAEHTPAGGAIGVRARRADGVVEIEVYDDGEGIEPELAARMFDRFQRGHGKGIGLGLAIVKQYVDLHGGEVEADSAAGEGTTFRFTLPDIASPGAGQTP